jgi:hypothetical protein
VTTATGGFEVQDRELQDRIARAREALEEEAQGHFEREARCAAERNRGGKETAHRRAVELQDIADGLRVEAVV